jgi:hypothetical protein
VDEVTLIDLDNFFAYGSKFGSGIFVGAGQ